MHGSNSTKIFNVIPNILSISSLVVCSYFTIHASKITQMLRWTIYYMGLVEIYLYVKTQLHFIAIFGDIKERRNHPSVTICHYRPAFKWWMLIHESNHIRMLIVLVQVNSYNIVNNITGSTLIFILQARLCVSPWIKSTLKELSSNV